MTKVLGIFGFLQFGWADVLDVAMVALLIFFLLRSIRGDSTVVNIVLVLTLLVVAQAIASALNMRMMTVLLSALLDVGVLAIIIIFQPEIRHLLNRFAMQTGISKRTGDRFDAEVNRRLIQNIFFKNSPLHDGAMIIVGNRIAAARCQLPMTIRSDIPASFGMRHRAAIGLSEDTDADVIVVSEETGEIRFVRNGEAKEVSMQELRQLLGSAMDADKAAKEE